MWVFNGNALIAGGIGLVVGVLLASTINNGPIAYFCGILVAMVVDVWMRYYSEDCEHPLIDPSAGAHVWFVPVWGVGIIMMVLIGLSHFRII